MSVPKIASDFTGVKYSAIFFTTLTGTDIFVERTIVLTLVVGFVVVSVYLNFSGLWGI